MPSRASDEAKYGPSSMRPKKPKRPSGTTVSGRAEVGGGLKGTKGSGTAKVGTTSGTTAVAPPTYSPAPAYTAPTPRSALVGATASGTGTARITPGPQGWTDTKKLASLSIQLLDAVAGYQPPEEGAPAIERIASIIPPIVLGGTTKGPKLVKAADKAIRASRKAENVAQDASKVSRAARAAASPRTVAKPIGRADRVPTPGLRKAETPTEAAKLKAAKSKLAWLEREGEGIEPSLLVKRKAAASKEIRALEAAAKPSGPRIAPRSPDRRLVADAAAAAAGLLTGVAGGFAVNAATSERGSTAATATMTPSTLNTDADNRRERAARTPQGQLLLSDQVRSPLNTRGQFKLARKILKAKAAAFAGGKLPIPGDEGVFINEIARQTGMSAKVIGAWLQAEGGNSTGDWNRLNIGHTDSGPIAMTADAGWSNPRSAAKLTADFMKGTYGGASSGIQGILSTARQSDTAQIASIAGSGWATNPDYHSLLIGTYNDQPDPSPVGNNKAAMKKWKALVKQGKKAGIYEVPEKGKKLAPVTFEDLTGRGTLNQVEKPVTMLAKHLARVIGEEENFPITSGVRPESAGSLHQAGHALDIEAYSLNNAAGTAATQARGDKIAYHAVLALAGKAEADAYRDAGFNGWWGPNGEEVIWGYNDASTGGDHTHHVHIGIPEGAPMPTNLKVKPMSVMQQVKSARSANAASNTASGGGVVPGTGMTVDQAAGILAGTPAAPQQQESLVGLGNYSGSITSANLPQAYVDLIMSAGSPGETGLLDEFLEDEFSKGRR